MFNLGLGFSHMKLWNAKIIKDNRVYFDIGLKVAEDALFCIAMSSYLNKVYLLNEMLYNYRFNSESVVRKFNNNYAKDYELAMKKTEIYIDTNGIHVDKKRFYNYVAYHILLIVINYCFHPENNNKGIKLLKQICKIPEF